MQREQLSCHISTSAYVPIHKSNNWGSTGARPERVNGVTKGFAGLFSRQGPFNLLWKHLHTKAGTAAQLEAGFNVEKLVPKRLKAAVGCWPSCQTGRNLSPGMGRRGRQPGPKDCCCLPWLPLSMQPACFPRKMEQICQEQGSSPQAAGTMHPTHCLVPQQRSTPRNGRESWHHSW